MPAEFRKSILPLLVIFPSIWEGDFDWIMSRDRAGGRREDKLTFCPLARSKKVKVDDRAAGRRETMILGPYCEIVADPCATA